MTNQNYAPPTQDPFNHVVPPKPSPLERPLEQQQSPAPLAQQYAPPAQPPLGQAGQQLAPPSGQQGGQEPVQQQASPQPGQLAQQPWGQHGTQVYPPPIGINQVYPTPPPEQTQGHVVSPPSQPPAPPQQLQPYQQNLQYQQTPQYPPYTGYSNYYPPAQQAGQQGGNRQPLINNYTSYLVLGILEILFCGGLLGIPAIVYAGMMNTAYTQGNGTLYVHYRKVARVWLIVGLVLGLIVNIWYVSTRLFA